MHLYSIRVLRPFPEINPFTHWCKFQTNKTLSLSLAHFATQFISYINFCTKIVIIKRSSLFKLNLPYEIVNDPLERCFRTHVPFFQDFCVLRFEFPCQFEFSVFLQELDGDENLKKKNNTKMMFNAHWDEIPVMAAVAMRKKVVSIHHFSPSFCFWSLQILIALEIREKYDCAKWVRWVKMLKITQPDNQLCSLTCCFVFACSHRNIYFSH